MPLVALGTATADNRSFEQMRDIAAAKLNRVAAVKGQMNGHVQPVNLECVADADAYTIFTSTDGIDGFAIVAKSELVDPLIGYSTEHFDPADMPAELKWYLQTVSRQLVAIESGVMKAPCRSAASFIPVENFITTQWSQDYPFDRKTPENYPSGCMATALAQCLNYRQYPPSAEFDATYYVTTKVGKNDTDIKKTAHVSSTYTWPYQNTYSSFREYSDNIDVLLRDCGYATYMTYSNNSSGTAGYLAGIALTKFFGYPEECVKYYQLDYFRDVNEWNQIIYDELAARSPILYGAFDPNPKVGGHAFVFSGVDAEGLVYVNWGWRGVANGFYSIELLNPTTNGTTDHFTDGHVMITGIRTAPLATDKVQPRIWGYTGDPYTFRWGKETDDKGTEHVTLYADLPYGFLNFSPSSFNGVFGLFAKDLTDGSEWVIAEELQDRDTILAGYGYCGDTDSYKSFYYYYFVDGEQGLKPGHTYRMSFGTKDDREGSWHSILCLGGEIVYELYYTGDPETSTVSEVISPLDDRITATRRTDDGITRVYDLQGRLVYSVSTERFNLWKVPARGVLVVRQGECTKKVVR